MFHLAKNSLKFLMVLALQARGGNYDTPPSVPCSMFQKKKGVFIVADKLGRIRTRNFATVVYPDSAPAGWQNILSEMCIPCFISPLHDKDINPDGGIKKPHFHVMLLFDNVKTIEQATDVFDKIGGVGHEIVQSARGYARYLCHLDNPEKAQYLVDDVKCYGGSDYITIIGLVTDKYKVIGEIIDYCEDNNIYCYADLLIFCRSEHFDWFRVLCDNGTFVVKEYLKSRSWGVKQSASN